MIERSDSAERIEPGLAREPMENAEAKERGDESGSVVTATPWGVDSVAD
jgi:hypothetical protein